MTPNAAGPGCPVHESFDPLSPEFLADPYAVMAALDLDGAPVFFAPSIGYYVVTRYADIDEVFRDPATYSAAVAQAPLVPLVPEAQQILLAGGHRPQPSMVSLDEPEHARLRKPAARAFSMRRVIALIPTIEATAARLLDAIPAQAEEFDLVAALAFPLPANIVFSLMGVPEQDYTRLKQWCGYRAALAWGRPAPEDQVEIATAMAAYRKYLRDLVDVKVGQPGDDVTSGLIAIHDEDPDRLRLDEISSILFSLSFAGHETTTGLIGNTARRLLEDPARWAQVVRDPDLIPAAVEESLRYDPSVPVWRRVLQKAAKLVREGQSLSGSLALHRRSSPASGDRHDRSGRIDRRAARHARSVAEFYEDDVATRVTAALSLIEPDHHDRHGHLRGLRADFPVSADLLAGGFDSVLTIWRPSNHHSPQDPGAGNRQRARPGRSAIIHEFVDLKEVRIDHDLFHSIPVDLMFRYNFVPIQARERDARNRPGRSAQPQPDRRAGRAARQEAAGQGRDAFADFRPAQEDRAIAARARRSHRRLRAGRGRRRREPRRDALDRPAGGRRFRHRAGHQAGGHHHLQRARAARQRYSHRNSRSGSRHQVPHRRRAALRHAADRQGLALDHHFAHQGHERARYRRAPRPAGRPFPRALQDPPDRFPRLDHADHSRRRRRAARARQRIDEREVRASSRSTWSASPKPIWSSSAATSRSPTAWCWSPDPPAPAKPPRSTRRSARSRTTKTRSSPSKIRSSIRSRASRRFRSTRKKGLTFARGLRSILRHDPDKIMVGEIRDQETAQIAINAALTGHLVFTTVHANNVLDVLGRFLNMGVEAVQLRLRAELHSGAAAGARDLPALQEAGEVSRCVSGRKRPGSGRVARRHVLRRRRLLRMRRHRIPRPQRHPRTAGSERAHSRTDSEQAARRRKSAARRAKRA